MSVGAALARAAWIGMAKAATEIAEKGTFGGFSSGGITLDLNGMFR
jgi:methylisocitrate lyase